MRATSAGFQTRCIEAGCSQNSDCPGGHTCAITLGDCGTYFPPVGYFCHTNEDTCTVDAECAFLGVDGSCRFNPADGFWACSDLRCVG